MPYPEMDMERTVASQWADLHYCYNKATCRLTEITGQILSSPDSYLYLPDSYKCLLFTQTDRFLLSC